MILLPVAVMLPDDEQWSTLFTVHEPAKPPTEISSLPVFVQVISATAWQSVRLSAHSPTSPPTSAKSLAVRVMEAPFTAKPLMLPSSMVPKSPK